MEEELQTENIVYKNTNDIIPILGGFGRFQQLITACLCIISIPSNLTVLIMYFASLESSWRCSSNSTLCHQNGTFLSDDKTRCTMQRSDWEFTEARSYSIITQFDIYCDKRWVVHLTSSIVFIGWAFGGVVLGWVSDNYGRKRVIFPSCLMIISVGFVAAFSPNVYFLIACRFIIGFCIPGTGSAIFLSEIVTTKYRPYAITVLWFMFSMDLCLLSLKAYYIRKWSTLFIVCTAPYLFVVAFYKFFPESIRWLHLHDKIDELRDQFHRIEYWNKKTLGSNYTILPLEKPERKYKASPMDVFKTRKMVVKFIVQAYGWLINSAIYYGLSLASDDFEGSLYTNFAILTAIECPANCLAMYLCDRFGRKKTTIGSMVFGGVACVAVAFIPVSGDIKFFRIVLGMLGKLSITMSFNAIYTWSIEIYTTNIRAEAMGFLQIHACLGAAVAPWIVKGLKSFHRFAPFIVMGVLSLIAAVGCLILPETKGKPMQDTNEEEQEQKQKLID